MKTARTARPKAIMMVWLMPRMMDGMACGIWTLIMVCRRVEPKLCATSTDVAGTCRMPRLVRRTTGGMA